MAILDTKRRLLQLKIVYYGPALCGKTTNLETLHRLVDPNGDTEIASLATEGDRTLFFDLLPIDLGELHGLRMTARLFTVPGQVFYNSTRRLVLQGADAVVFVADSRPDSVTENRESITNLHRNLMANGVRPGALPIIIQANKRDLPGALPLADFESRVGADDLRKHGHIVLTPLVAASALRGEGVIESFGAALAASIPEVHGRYGLDRLGLTRAAMRTAVDKTLAAYPRVPPPALANVDRSITPPADPAAPAVASHVAPHPEPPQVMPPRPDAGDMLAALAHFAASTGNADASVDEVAMAAAEAARAALTAGATASLLLVNRGGRLEAAALAGLSHDPFLATGKPSLASTLLESGRAQYFYDLDTELVFSDTELSRKLEPHLTAAVVPIEAGDHRGILCVYGTNPDARATAATLRFLTIVAAITVGALSRAPAATAVVMDRRAALV